MNTTEKNILIAEFLCTTQKTKDLDDCYILNGKAYHIEDLNFHSSWEWLMQVVEKCLIGEAEHTDKKAIELIKAIYDALCNTNKLEVFEACVEFIQWFNENEK